MCAVLLAVGEDNARFIALGCINGVVAANAGGAFSPFGDITTLMVWQKGIVDFWTFFLLLVPSLVIFLVPAALMYFAVLSIGSAAGVALMDQARGKYTFYSQLLPPQVDPGHRPGLRHQRLGPHAAERRGLYQCPSRHRHRPTFSAKASR